MRTLFSFVHFVLYVIFCQLLSSEIPDARRVAIDDVVSDSEFWIPSREKDSSRILDSQLPNPNLSSKKGKFSA